MVQACFHLGSFHEAAWRRSDGRFQVRKDVAVPILDARNRVTKKFTVALARCLNISAFRDYEGNLKQQISDDAVYRAALRILSHADT